MKHEPIPCELSPDMPTDSVVIGYCHTGMVHEQFAASLALTMMLEGQKVKGFIRTQGPIIPVNRNEIVNKFLLSPEMVGAEWLWMVDTDMEFPPWAIRQLINVAQATGADIVCGEYATKEGVTIIAKNPGMRPMLGLEAGKAYECDGGGTGCMLISRKILEKVRDGFPSDAPWGFFKYEHFPKPDGTRLFVGEDFVFCLRAKAVGAKIVAWAGLQLGHVKTKTMRVKENAS